MQEAYLIPIQDITTGVQRRMMKDSLRLPTLDETLELAITYDNSKMIESLLAAGASDRAITKMPQDRVPGQPSPFPPFNIRTESSLVDSSTKKLGEGDRNMWICHCCNRTSDSGIKFSSTCTSCGHHRCGLCKTE